MARKKVSTSKKTISKPSKTKRLLNETDRLAYIVSVVLTLILGFVYFSLWHWGTTNATEQAIRDFSLSLITNLIPVFLLFAFSYALLRRIQTIKSEEEQEELVQGIINELQLHLENEIQGLFEKDFVDINHRLDLLAKTADFAGRKEELGDLQRIHINLKGLEENITRHTRILSDTVKEEFIDLNRKFRELEDELKAITIKDVKRVLEIELQALKIGLSTQEINELSTKVSASVEQSIQKIETERMQYIGSEIDTGFSSIQGKVNETVVELQYQQKELSQNIIEKIDNHQDVITFVSEIRGERDDLLSIMWKNVQDEFSGEIKHGLRMPREMIKGKLIKEMGLVDDKADEIASELTKTFLVFLSDALGRMQGERITKLEKKPRKKDNKKSLFS